MNNKKVPENFTFSLVLVDSIPVILFSISMILISQNYKSLLFTIGSLLCVFAGLGKVIWKIIIVFFKKNIDFFFKQFRVLMPSGFLLMIVSLFVNKLDLKVLYHAITKFPNGICFLLAILTFCSLMVMAKKFDKNSARDNWIEQFTNILAQVFILLGIIL